MTTLRLPPDEPGPAARLREEEARTLLRECAHVVKPGEVVFYCPSGDWTPNELREISEMIRYWAEYEAPDVRVLVLPAGSVTVAEAPDA